MSRRKREKAYWLKKSEHFTTGAAAKERAGILRMNEHTAHVTMTKKDKVYLVQYSVAKWYWEVLKQTKTTL